MYETGQLAYQTQLQGRYLILSPAGSGGMGYVYKAMDLQEKRHVAIKEMSQKDLTTPGALLEAQKRLRQEADMLRNMAHPNLPRVYDTFDEYGRSFIVMDFIEGKTLSQLLAESPGQRLPVKDVVDYAIQLCRVLTYLHQQSPQPIIFRDLKPSNVMVTADGHVYLIDFGIARFFKHGQRMDTVAFGTLGFSSPELVSGDQTEPRSDLYSLGATLHYCLTGRDPKSNKPTLFAFPSVRSSNLSVPVYLDSLILQLVATRVKDRPASANNVLLDLERVSQGMLSSSVNLNGGGNNGMGHFYDEKTARVVTLQSWLLLRFNKLPGFLRIWWIALVPLLMKTGGLAWALFGSTCVPLSRKAYAVFGQVAKDVWYTTQRGPMSQAWMVHIRKPVVILPAIMVSGSLFLLVFLHSPLYLVMLFLCIFLLLLAFGASFHQRVGDPVWSVLVAITVIAFLLCLVLFSQIQPIIANASLGQVLNILIICLGCAAVLRAGKYFVWADHVLVIVVAVICLLLQYPLVIQAPLQFQRLASSTAGNILPIIVPGLVAIISLFRLTRPFSSWDRVMVGCVALTYAWLQMPEVRQSISIVVRDTPLSMAMLSALLNLFLTVGPGLLALCTFRLPVQYSLIGRLPLLILALAQQQFLTSIASYSPPLNQSMGYFFKSINLGQCLTFVCVLAIIALLCSMFKRNSFPGIDNFAVMSIAIVCLVLQTSVWENRGNGGSCSEQVQNCVSAVNVLLARMLEGILVIALICSLLYFLVYLAPGLPGRDRIADSFGKGLTILKHLMVLLILAICVSLQWPFGASAPFQDILVSIEIGKITLDQSLLMLTLVMVPFALFSFRWSQPLTRGEHLILLVAAVVGASQLMRSGKSLSLSIIQLPTNVFSIPLITFGLLLAVAVSLVWLRKPPTQVNSQILRIVLGCAAACVLLQFVQPTFMLAVLILLIQGVLLVAEPMSLQGGRS